jgi:hypothetical protein
MEGEAVHMLQSGHHQWNKGQPTLQAFPATQRLNSRLHQISEETKKMAPKLVFVLPVVLLALALQAILRPPPPKLCGSPGGPPLTSPRIKLRDGRYLAYKEDGVQRDKARYKIITVHAFDSTKDFPSPVSKVKKKKSQHGYTHFHVLPYWFLGTVTIRSSWKDWEFTSLLMTELDMGKVTPIPTGMSRARR